MGSRLDRVRPCIDEEDVDAVLLTSLPDIRWACGFTGSNAYLIVGSRSTDFVTDGRYTDQARDEVEGAEVHIARGNLSDLVAEKGLLDSYRRVGFQAESVTVAQRETFEEEHSSVQWSPVSQMLTPLRGKKEASEVDRIRQAQSITEEVFERVLDMLSPGMTEREVAAKIVYWHLRRGADSMSFEPIVASGPNAARPHARPTDRQLQEGDFVVLDMGCFRDGYASDMTRTVAMGPPRSEARRGYEAVQAAQAKAVEEAKAGLTGKELDAVARDALEEAGLGDFFTHSLGHGIGLEVHEWPRVSHTSDEELPEGACVTIEPGVYVPDEEYGVRIEDIVVLREEGNERLTRAQRGLIELSV